MTDSLDVVLASLHAIGYDSVTREDGFNEASGVVPLPEEHRCEPRTGWRRFLPRVYYGGDPTFVPNDLRATVETHDWMV